MSHALISSTIGFERSRRSGEPHTPLVTVEVGDLGLDRVELANQLEHLRRLRPCRLRVVKLAPHVPSAARAGPPAVSRALGRAIAPGIARLVARALLGRRTEKLAVARVELLLQKRELLLDREDRILAARDGELLRELEETLVQPSVLLLLQEGDLAQALDVALGLDPDHDDLLASAKLDSQVRRRELPRGQCRAASGRGTKTAGDSATRPIAREPSRKSASSLVVSSTAAARSFHKLAKRPCSRRFA